LTSFFMRHGGGRKRGGGREKAREPLDGWKKRKRGKGETRRRKGGKGRSPGFDLDRPEGRKGKKEGRREGEGEKRKQRLRSGWLHQRREVGRREGGEADGENSTSTAPISITAAPTPCGKKRKVEKKGTQEKEKRAMLPFAPTTISSGKKKKKKERGKRGESEGKKKRSLLLTSHQMRARSRKEREERGKKEKGAPQKKKGGKRIRLGSGNVHFSPVWIDAG